MAYKVFSVYMEKWNSTICDVAYMIEYMVTCQLTVIGGAILLIAVISTVIYTITLVRVQYTQTIAAPKLTVGCQQLYSVQEECAIQAAVKYVHTMLNNAILANKQCCNKLCI